MTKTRVSAASLQVRPPEASASPSLRSSSFREVFVTQHSSSSVTISTRLPVCGYIFFTVFLVSFWLLMLFPSVVHFFPTLVSHVSHHGAAMQNMGNGMGKEMGMGMGNGMGMGMGNEMGNGTGHGMMNMMGDDTMKMMTTCANYTGQMCGGWFMRPGLSQRNIHLKEKETLINSAVMRLMKRHEAYEEIESCRNLTLEYLCQRAFIPCGREAGMMSDSEDIEADIQDNCPTNYLKEVDEMLSPNISVFPKQTEGKCLLPMKQKDGVCELPCSWDAFPPKSQIMNKLVMAVSLSISTFCCGIILISYMQINVMKRFPHVIPIYISLCSTTTMWIVGIPLIASYGLYCSDYFIPHNQQFTESPFCTIQGFVFQYCIIAQSNWFCCLVYNIYRATVTTQRFSSDRDMMRRLHVIQSAACWLIPLIVSTIGYLNGGYGNHHGNKQVCVLKDEDMHYYTLVLPVQLSTLASATLLSFAVFFMKKSEIKSHTVARKRSVAQGHKPPVHIVNKIEKKLMGLSGSFVVLNAFLLTRLTFCIHQRNDLDREIEDYRQCLADLTKDSCSPNYTMFLHPEISIICNMVIGMYPLAVLIFLPSNKMLITLWRRRAYSILGFFGFTNPASLSEFSTLKISESVILRRQ